MATQQTQIPGTAELYCFVILIRLKNMKVTFSINPNRMDNNNNICSNYLSEILRDYNKSLKPPISV